VIIIDSKWAEAELKDRYFRRFDLTNFCFKEQLSFIRDKSPFKTAVCSRRAGKTIACAAHLWDEAQANPDRVCLYITLSRNNAKKLIWKELLKIRQQYAIDSSIDSTELSIKLKNGSVIYVSGAKDKTEIEKFRGLAITLCYIDECQSFKSYLQDLIDEVIAPALMDYAGTLCLIGTPGPVPNGYFYESSHNAEWSHHKWTYCDNPWISLKSNKTHQEVLERELKRRGVTTDHPSIQREWFGKWVTDSDSLVIKYSNNKNHYDVLPNLHKPWQIVIGIDIGFDDADAIAVIGSNEHAKEAYLIEEIIAPKQGITELAESIQKLVKKYDVNRIVMDTGGLGKKVAEEIRRRFAIPIQAAEKTRKFEFIELLNDALRTGKFFAKRDSRFAQDSYLVEYDWDKSSQDKLVVSDRYHSDIIDATLYAFRESLHWLYEPEIPQPKPATPEWFLRQEEEMLEAAMNSMQQRSNDNDFDEFL